MSEIDDIKRKIERLYDKKRSDAQEKAIERKLSIEKQVPELIEINRDISRQGLNIMKRVINGELKGDEGKVLVEKKMEELSKKRLDILRRNNISEDYEDIVYECTECNDTGYIEGVGRCKCYEQLLLEEIGELSNMKKLLEYQNFSTIDVSLFSDDVNESGESQKKVMVQNINTSIDFVEKFDDPEFPSLFFYGPTGVGKTFLSSCIAREILKKGGTVIYKSSSHLMDLAKEITFGNPDGMTKEEYKFLEKCDLLIIDDLGSELINRFVVSEIYKVINSRIVAGKKVIISTNLNLKEFLDQYTSRIFYRVVENYKMLEFIGPNLRCEKLKKNAVLNDMKLD